jgi:hypothetical protein
MSVDYLLDLSAKHMLRRHILILLFLVWALRATADQPETLSARAYARDMPSKGLVIFKVNWGRKWGCAHVDNAQLVRLTFSQLPLRAASPTLDLKTPSKLFVKDEYVPYAYLIDPGTYAITAFDVMVARSQWDVVHVVGNKDQLFENENPIGGTFEVSANEIVYIGHFALDCAQETIPWRYYLKERSAFDTLVSGFRNYYPFASALPIQYRLFNTTMFGQPFSLPDEPGSATAEPVEKP